MSVCHCVRKWKREAGLVSCAVAKGRCGLRAFLGRRREAWKLAENVCTSRMESRCCIGERGSRNAKPVRQADRRDFLALLCVPEQHCRAW